MAKETWVLVPNYLNLCDPANWQKTGKGKFKASRYHLAIIEQKETSQRTSPSLFTIIVRKGMKPVFGNKRIVTVTNVTTITENIENSFSSKLAAESSLKNSLGGKDVFAIEVQSKISSEITQALSSQLSSTRSYQVQSTHEFMSSMSLEYPENGDPGKEIKHLFYLPLWPVHWDVYLYKVESIELTYSRQWFKRGLRNVFKKARNFSPLVASFPKIPLARISFYEPQEIPLSHLGEYKPEVDDAERITVSSPPSTCPELKLPMPDMSLEDCAKIAFPETEQESEDQEAVTKASQKRRESPIHKHLEKAQRRYPAAAKAAAKKSAAAKRSTQSVAAKKSAARDGTIKRPSIRGGAKSMVKGSAQGVAKVGAAKGAKKTAAKGGVKSRATGVAKGGTKVGAAKGGMRSGSNRGRGGRGVR
jgi:hypothetical protein